MKYNLKYCVKVQDSKYREFLNVLENILDKDNPDKCSNRSVFQSISDIHVFEYNEAWEEISSLNKYLVSNEFKSFKGAMELLTEIKNYSITEFVEVEKSQLLLKL